jgi:O-acetylhomoserine (thiol)-lyase
MRDRHGRADGRAADARAHGDHIVASRTLYGGTYSQLAVTFAQFGIDATFCDPDDIDAFRRALTPRTKAIYAETIGNPQLNVCDIAALAEVAHGAGVPLVIDNTLASPYLVPAVRPRRRPRDPFGHQVPRRPRHDDGRHRRRVGQVRVGQRQLPADDRALARLPRRALLRDVRRLRLHDEGAHGDDAHARADAVAFAAFLLLQGIETLHLRMPRHCEAAMAVAKHLAKHPRVAWVRYPGLPGNPTSARPPLPAQGAGGILTFGVAAAPRPASA